MLKGRYLNGEADLKASLTNGVLIVTLDSLEVNGKRVPDEMMANIRQENLAKDAYKNPKHAEILRKLESLEIKDGKMTIKVQAETSRSRGKSSGKGSARRRPCSRRTKKDAAPIEKTPPTKPASEPAEPSLPKR